MNYSPKNQSLKNQSAYKSSFKSQSLKARSLKARSLKTLIIAIAGLVSLGNNPASATPVLNHQGDYVGSTIMGYQAWEVVDSDPRGLNCRMKQEFQPAILDAMDLPVALEENYHSMFKFLSYSPTHEARSGFQTT